MPPIDHKQMSVCEREQLSEGSLLSAFTNKKVYQPVWQIIYIYEPPANSPQILLSDGKQVTQHAALHPSCVISYQKKAWKLRNNGKQPGDVLKSYRLPVIKVIDYVIKSGNDTTVLFLSKIKLLGWENADLMPEVLSRRDVEVVLGTGEVVVKSKENFDGFDEPRLEQSSYEYVSDEVTFKCDIAGDITESSLEDRKFQWIGKSMTKKSFNPDLLKSGDLRFLGPDNLNILKICSGCGLLAYQTENQVATFVPPAKSLVDFLSTSDLLSKEQIDSLEFCSCLHSDENSLRKEFQNKCMVVNQDSSSDIRAPRVQCVIVNRENKPAKDSSDDSDARDEKVDKKAVKNNGIISEIGRNGKLPRISKQLRVCEYCGVEEAQMSGCRQCGKVWYCSPPCRRADAKPHTAVCRAFITVRRYNEERAAFSLQLREPVDGCMTCGFYRDSLEQCSLCLVVAFCCTSCAEVGKDRHKPVCDAFVVIQNYTRDKLMAREQEVD